jgi:RNA polymerase sigma-70 factor (ECF subfamily)
VDEFEQFYQRTYTQMFRVLATVTGAREDAADLCQEAYGKAARQWGKVGQLDNPTGWVRRVALNGAVDLHRRAARQRRALRRLAPAQEHEHLDDLSLEVLDALRALPMAERQVVVLHHLLSLTTAEIAEELDRPQGTVKAQLVRGRHRLAAALRLSVEEVPR